MGCIQGCFSHAHLLMASAHPDIRGLCDDPQTHNEWQCCRSPGKLAIPPALCADAAPRCDALPGSDMSDVASRAALPSAALSCPCGTVSPSLQHLLQPAPQSCCPVVGCQLPTVHLQAATAKLLGSWCTTSLWAICRCSAGNFSMGTALQIAAVLGPDQGKQGRLGTIGLAYGARLGEVAHHLRPDSAAAAVIMHRGSPDNCPHRASVHCWQV